MAEFNPNIQKVAHFLTYHSGIDVLKNIFGIKGVLGAFTDEVILKQKSMRGLYFMVNDIGLAGEASEPDRLRGLRPVLSLDHKRRKAYNSDIDQAITIANQGVAQ